MKFIKIAAIVLILLGANSFFGNKAKLPDYVDDEIALADLPTDRAIKYVKGTGKPILATFEDPNCPYCASLDEQLYALDNVTIYTFLVPILSEDSWEKSRRIWCAAVPLNTWKNWMLKQQEPSDTANCDMSALNRNIAMLQRLDASGVPYVLAVKD
ncbi:MAG: DsbC family protein [Azoarcus sp.]|jgi:thiol:disulfide interchange protein DsbC|nr:DsbC family protein [Azoarcus sp.]